jgi:uncharacterized protein with HEPN domain
MRDIVAHQDFGVDLETVWLVAANELPELKFRIQKIKDELGGSPI